MLSLKRRASHVHQTLARVTNPVPLAASGPLGALLDGRCSIVTYLAVEHVVSWGHYGSNWGGLGAILAPS